MDVKIRYAIGRFAGQAVNIPVLHGIGLLVQKVIDPQARAPAVGESVVQIGVPFPIA